MHIDGSPRTPAHYLEVQAAFRIGLGQVRFQLVVRPFARLASMKTCRVLPFRRLTGLHLLSPFWADATKAMQTILVLDDDTSNLKVISFVLRSRGYDVLEASGGAEAIRICKSHDQPIHLLIADVKIPDIPGTQVALRVIESCPDSAILFVSGTAVSDWTTDERAILERLPPGSFEILEKPFTPTALEERVQRFMDQRFRTESEASCGL